MQLGRLNKLLVNNRKDFTISETRFIGELIDQARVTNESLNNHPPNYAIVMKNSFLCNSDRSPLSNANARAILAQRTERHNLVVEYLKNNISLDGLIAITKEIIQEDNLYYSSKAFSNCNQECFITDIKEKNKDNSIDEQLPIIYADYITEYYYYSVLWNTVDFALGGVYELRKPFGLFETSFENSTRIDYIKVFNSNIIGKHTDSYVYNILSCDNRLFKIYKKHFDVYAIKDELIFEYSYDIPLDLVGLDHAFIFNEIRITNDFIVALDIIGTDILVYQLNCRNIWKNIHLPLGYNNLRGRKIELINNDLVLIYDDFYLIINLIEAKGNISENKKDYIDSFEKIIKKVEFPPYELVQTIDLPERKIEFLKSSIYISDSEENILDFKKEEFIKINSNEEENNSKDNNSNHHKDTNDLDILKSTNDTDDKETYKEASTNLIKQFYMSSSGRFMVSVDNNNIGQVLDFKIKSQYQIIENNSPKIDFFGFKTFSADIDSITKVYFSKDEKFLIYSHCKGRNHTTEIINLKNISNKKSNDVRIYNEPMKLIGWNPENNYFIVLGSGTLYKNTIEKKNGEIIVESKPLKFVSN